MPVSYTHLDVYKRQVVCIAKGDKLKFDISHDARLVNVSDYMVEGYKGLLGFLSGIHAGNYDICLLYTSRCV